MQLHQIAVDTAAYASLPATRALRGELARLSAEWTAAPAVTAAGRRDGLLV